MYGAIALALAVAVILSLQFFAVSDADAQTDADEGTYILGAGTLINLGTASSGADYNYTLGTPGTLHFLSGADGQAYELSGTDQFNITFDVGIQTIDITFSGVAMTGNIVTVTNVGSVTLNLFLNGTNTVNGSILICQSHTIYLDNAPGVSNGNLSVTGTQAAVNNGGNAAIGSPGGVIGVNSGKAPDAGEINILGGTITATGGPANTATANAAGGAGIGGGGGGISSGTIGGNGGHGGTINILGGTITATGVAGGAGIGGGGGGTASNSKGGDGGNITINGAHIISASGGTGGGAGIGGGGTKYASGTANATTNKGGDGGTIKIIDSVIDLAQGGAYGGAGIGGGGYHVTGTTAGGGKGGDGGNITITDSIIGDGTTAAPGAKGSVTTISGSGSTGTHVGGAGIGGGGATTSPTPYGSGGDGGTIIINGTSVNTTIIYATGGAYSAGIGGGCGGFSQTGYPAVNFTRGGYGGTIEINGGTVVANGDPTSLLGGAGIGGGRNGSCGDITINGTPATTNVTAKGTNNSAGIGASGSGISPALTNGNITINGGEVKATGGSGAAGIGAALCNGGKITINGTIETTIVNATGGSGSAAGIGGSNTYNFGEITINGGTVIATANYLPGYPGSAGTGAGIGGGTGSKIGEGKITIDGSSTYVEASGSQDHGGAGIGGGYQGSCGEITIKNGTIIATGGKLASSPGAGIGAGGGILNTGCMIKIEGGNVTAIGGAGIIPTGGTAAGGGAGIGGGNSGNSGTIIITGGIITAIGGSPSTASGNSTGGAGIGGGSGGAGGTITITGGNITAIGGNPSSVSGTIRGGAGIGGGGNAISGAAITIIGGTVTATGGWNAAGIGGGGGGTTGGAGGTITINNGIVTANGGNGNGAGIGGGGGSTVGGDGGIINLNGGTISAISYGAGAGIGGGNGACQGAQITFEPAADIRAYAIGTDKPAIHAYSVSGDGYFVNALLDAPLSASAVTQINVVNYFDPYEPSTGMTSVIVLDLPANYKGFAFQIRADASSSIEYALYVLDGSDLMCIVHLDETSHAFGDDTYHIISSINSANGYDPCGSSAFISLLPVKLESEWEVTFDLDGGAFTVLTDNPQLVPKHGFTATKPTDPEKTDFTFAGWYCVETDDLWDFDDDVEGNITLIAMWDEWVDVNFFDSTGTFITTVSVIKGTAIAFSAAPTAPAAPAGDKIVWVDEFDDPWNFATAVDGDLDLYMTYEYDPSAWATVTFNSNGGSLVGSLTVLLSDGYITAPTAPTKDGYTFAGWFENAGLTGTAVNFSSKMFTGDATLYAKWEFNPADWYVISFDVDGTVTDAYAPKSTGLIDLVPADPAKSGFTFAGWFYVIGTGTAVNPSAEVFTSNETLYADWDAIVIPKVKITVTPPTDGKIQWSDSENGTYQDFPSSGFIEVDEGTEIWFKIIPDDGYLFISWTGDVSGDTEKTSVTATGADIDIGATFLLGHAVTVTAGKAVTVEYTFNGAVKGTMAFGDGGGSQTVMVPAGYTLGLKVLSGHAGFGVEWDDVSAKTAGTAYSRVVNGPYSVTLNLTPQSTGDPATDDGNSNMILLLVAALAAVAGILLLFLLLRKRAVITGVVRKNGKGVEGVKIEYKKKGDSSSKTVTTDAEGKYKIKTSLDAELTITAAGASGTEVTVKKKVTEKDIDI